MDCSPPGSSVHGIFQVRILPFPPPGNLPDPNDQTHISSVSSIGRSILNHWATRKVLLHVFFKITVIQESFQIVMQGILTSALSENKKEMETIQIGFHALK